MNKNLVILLSLAFAIAVIPMLTSEAYGQKGTKMKKEALADIASTKSTGGAKGADPNVKSTERTNKATDTAEAKQGRVCGIFWDNYTRLYIKIFVDGEYEGTVSPMGELQTYAIAGATRIYARADFDDGSTQSWGPQAFQCTAGVNYTRKLN